MSVTKSERYHDALAMIGQIIHDRQEAVLTLSFNDGELTGYSAEYRRAAWELGEVKLRRKKKPGSRKK